MISSVMLIGVFIVLMQLKSSLDAEFFFLWSMQIVWAIRVLRSLEGRTTYGCYLVRLPHISIKMRTMKRGNFVYFAMYMKRDIKVWQGRIPFKESEKDHKQ